MLTDVLVVEPDADNREMYREALIFAGFRVYACAEYLEGLVWANRAQAIVTGLGRGGLDFIRTVRANDGTRHTPIIVVTASVFEANRRDAEQAGCDLFLPKPCLPTTVIDALRGLLPY